MAFEAGSSSNSQGLVTGNMSARQGETALIVDDCNVAKIISTAVLSHFGYQVSAVTDGEQAVDMYKAGEGHFNLIIMDLEMPVKNGIEATKELRAMGVDCMIVGVTASNNQSEMQSFREAGLDHLFNKPLSIPKLQSCFGNGAAVTMRKMLSSISRVLVFMYERQPLPNIVTPSCNGCIPERVILIDSHDVIYFKTNLVLLGFLRRVNGWFYDYKVGEKRYELPPGDMGWPFIGNMWSFLLAFKSNNPDSFVSSFIQRVHSHFDRILESGPAEIS